MLNKGIIKSVQLENKAYYAIIRRVTGMMHFVKPCLFPISKHLSLPITHTGAHACTCMSTRTNTDDIRKNIYNLLRVISFINLSDMIIKIHFLCIEKRSIYSYILITFEWWH